MESRTTIPLYKMHLGFFFFFKGGRGMKKQNLELFCVEKIGG